MEWLIDAPDADPAGLAREIEDVLGLDAGTLTVVLPEPAAQRTLGEPPGPFTPDQLEQVRQVVRRHVSGRQRQLDQLRVKARAVWRGEGTFTQAQAQKILAGLVLTELRDR